MQTQGVRGGWYRKRSPRAPREAKKSRIDFVGVKIGASNYYVPLKPGMKLL